MSRLHLYLNDARCSIFPFADIVQLRKRMAGFNEMTDTALQKVMNLAIQSALHTAVFTFIGGRTLCSWAVSFPVADSL